MGFAGMYILHCLRRRGLTARAFEAGSDVGGTWYWNRYPGCRVDFDSVQYSYNFSDELTREWEWTEKFAAQPELLRYANHVADRFDLRRDAKFDTRVTSAVFDDETNLWTLHTDRGDVATARYCIMATGSLSTPYRPPCPGIEDFRGEWYHTAQQAQEDWTEHSREVAEATLMPVADSWYVGANVAGKPRVYMPYFGGFERFWKTCTEIARDGYRGFILSRVGTGDERTSDAAD